MLLQIVIGTLLIAGTIMASTVLVAAGLEGVWRLDSHMRRLPPVLHVALSLAAMTLWMVGVITIMIWVWALAFLTLDIFSSLEAALYFSLVVFTTLGFGDVILPDEWRLLSGFVATNGFILFGLSTAVLFEIMSQIYRRRGAGYPHNSD